MLKISLLALFGILFLGCVQQEQNYVQNSGFSADSDTAVSNCISLCKENPLKLDLDSSPCLSNEISPDWVCDIAHNPRMEIDNIAENQCSSFRDGKAKHFVELDQNCLLIKKY